jgi:hypothetical protein
MPPKKRTKQAKRSRRKEGPPTLRTRSASPVADTSQPEFPNLPNLKPVSVPNTPANWARSRPTEGTSPEAYTTPVSDSTTPLLETLGPKRPFKTNRYRPPTPPPVDTNTDNFDTEVRNSLTAAENQTVIELEGQLLSSALRGFSSDESASERNSSSDSKERAELFPSPKQGVQKEPPSSSTYTPSIVTTTNMSPFDSKLEYALTQVFMFDLTHPVSLCLDVAFIHSFDDFRSLDMADVRDFEYTAKKGPNSGNQMRIHPTSVRNVQCAINYCTVKSDAKDAESHDPTKWNEATYSEFRRSGHALYIASLPPPTPATASGITGTPVVASNQQQKDDDAALVSWNRKPRDVAKYPLLKTDADYLGWKLKMKRQLIADTLSRVTNPSFDVITCRLGSDQELASLQVNFFEQILSAVLLNPEGKGLVITHPEDALYIGGIMRFIKSLLTLLKLVLLN